MMKTKRRRILVCAGICAALAVGSCIISQAETTQEETQAPPEQGGGVMAKIVSIGDDTLTVYLSEKPDGAMGEMTPPADGETPPELPEEAERTAPPKLPSAEAAEGGQQREMMFSEEAVTLTLTSDTTVTKGMGQESGTRSELTEGSVVRLLLDGTTVVSIEMMQ